MTKTGSLWELMNRDVSKIVGKKDSPSSSAVPRARVEEVWDEANARAQERGVPVTDVLREMGFDLGAAAPEPSPEVQEKKREMLESLNWNDGTSSSASAPNPFDDLPGADARKAIRNVRELSARLELLTDQTAFELSTVVDAASRSEGWWAECMAGGIDARALESVVRSLPYYPPKPTGDEFAEHMMVNDICSFKDVRAATRAAFETPMSTFAWMADQGQLDETKWLAALTTFTDIASPSGTPRAAKVADRESFPSEWAHRFGVVPVAGGKVAFPFAPDALIIEALRTAWDRDFEPILVTRATATALAGAFSEQSAPHLAAPSAPGQANPSKSRRSLVGDYSILESATHARSAVELVRMLFQGALQSNATDIHLERFADSARVRYRIDGMLHKVMNIDRMLYDEVIARVKILADMDITERRRPQDGHLHLNLGGRTYDLRIASVPTKRGEKIAIRLASTGRIEIRLDALGLVPAELEKLRDIITRPYGIVLASGPVGSGKTTTLYAALNEFDREETNVATIEDPVEIELDGANQVEVNYTLGLDFATGLRALLRQDPDTLLIGEIRDEETASIAARAGMTGRMVFSTLHANESVGAVTTLRNFGLAAHLVASALQGVIAQRLLRTLCENCKAPSKATQADQELFKTHGLQVPKPFTCWSAVGCEDCYGSGYSGRMGVFEVLRVDSEIRDLILDAAPERVLRAKAIENGLRSLQQDALDKIHAGHTSLEEYRRVLRF